MVETATSLGIPLYGRVAIWEEIYDSLPKARDIVGSRTSRPFIQLQVRQLMIIEGNKFTYLTSGFCIPGIIGELFLRVWDAFDNDVKKVPLRITSKANQSLL